MGIRYPVEHPAEDGGAVEKRGVQASITLDSARVPATEPPTPQPAPQPGQDTSGGAPPSNVE